MHELAVHGQATSTAGSAWRGKIASLLTSSNRLQAGGPELHECLTPSCGMHHKFTRTRLVWWSKSKQLSHCAAHQGPNKIDLTLCLPFTGDLFQRFPGCLGISGGHTALDPLISYVLYALTSLECHSV